jgi:hypothetical protein
MLIATLTGFIMSTKPTETPLPKVALAVVPNVKPVIQGLEDKVPIGVVLYSLSNRAVRAYVPQPFATIYINSVDQSLPVSRVNVRPLIFEQGFISLKPMGAEFSIVYLANFFDLSLAKPGVYRCRLVYRDVAPNIHAKHHRLNLRSDVGTVSSPVFNLVLSRAGRWTVESSPL